jgi:phenylpyruvate tautomerase PptA (4-oxalocrotonate tautomerase family)
MPAVLIEVQKKYSVEEEKSIISALNEAFQEAFNVGSRCMYVRFLVHELERVFVPSSKINPERYTMINVDCFEGRSLEAKRKLYQCIVQNLEPLGIPKDHVKILLRESAKENWGMRGGQAACDLEFDS